MTLGRIAEAIAIAVSIGFIVSMIYDWGFAFALGIDLRSLPATRSDHFNTGLLWFPYLLLVLLSYFAYELYLKKIERGLTEKEIIATSKNPTLTRRFRESPYKFLTAIGVLMLINFVLIGDVASAALPFGAMVVWLLFSFWCISTPLISLRVSQEIRAAYMFLPVVFILAFFSGYNSAVEAANREPTLITIKNVNSPIELQGKLLRLFDRGVFMLEDNAQITLVPWAKIETLKRQKRYEPFRGLLCEWFGHCTDDAKSKADKS